MVEEIPFPVLYHRKALGRHCPCPSKAFYILYMEHIWKIDNKCCELPGKHRAVVAAGEFCNGSSRHIGRSPSSLLLRGRLNPARMAEAWTYRILLCRACSGSPCSFGHTQKTAYHHFDSPVYRIQDKHLCHPCLQIEMPPSSQNFVFPYLKMFIFSISFV